MSREKQIEEMALTEVDILANDLNQHCADLAENYCGGVHCVACLAHALTAKGYRKSTDVAEEIFAEMESTIKGIIVLLSFSYNGSPKEIQCKKDCYKDMLGYIAELKKKYTEGDV